MPRPHDQPEGADRIPHVLDGAPLAIPLTIPIHVIGPGTNNNVAPGASGRHSRPEAADVSGRCGRRRPAFEAAEDGQLEIVTLSTNNLRRAFICIIKRAGLEPWEDVFQTLRRSRETEWSLEYPPHVVSEWVGHSVKVSADHYLQVPDSLMDRAAGNTVTMGSQGSESDEPPEGAPERPAQPVNEDNSSDQWFRFARARCKNNSTRARNAAK